MPIILPELRQAVVEEQHICCGRCGEELEASQWMLSNKPGWMMRALKCLACVGPLMTSVLQYQKVGRKES